MMRGVAYTRAGLGGGGGGGGEREVMSSCPLFSGGGVHVEVRVGGGLLSTHWSGRACRGLGREGGEKYLDSFTTYYIGWSFLLLTSGGTDTTLRTVLFFISGMSRWRCTLCTHTHTQTHKHYVTASGEN